jgi:hypothetical protein
MRGVVAVLAGMLIAAAAFVSAGEPEAQVLGAGLTIEQPTPIAALLAEPEDHAGKAVRIDGVVTEVCARHGDWLKVAGPRSGSGILVRVEGGGFSFPSDCLNRPVSVEGVLEAGSDEGGDAPRVCAAMTRGGVRFHLRATGAALRRPGSHPRPL